MCHIISWTYLFQEGRWGPPHETFIWEEQNRDGSEIRVTERNELDKRKQQVECLDAHISVFQSSCLPFLFITNLIYIENKQPNMQQTLRTLHIKKGYKDMTVCVSNVHFFGYILKSLLKMCFKIGWKHGQLCS